MLDEERWIGEDPGGFESPIGRGEDGAIVKILGERCLLSKLGCEFSSLALTFCNSLYC